MNKKLWIGIYAASLALFVILAIPCGALLVFENFTQNLVREAGLRMADVMPVILIVLVLAYAQFALLHAIYNFLVLARMWGVIQDGQTPITVGKAIGYLFIPFFNIYWIFKAWGGFPAEYNRYVARYRLNVPIVPNGAFVAYPVALMLAAFLYVPILLLPFVFLVVVSKACDAVNALRRSVEERRAAAGCAQAAGRTAVHYG